MQMFTSFLFILFISNIIFASGEVQLPRSIAFHVISFYFFTSLSLRPLIWKGEPEVV